MKLKRYTEEQLRDACATSLSFREVLRKLNISPAGGNYQTLHKAISFFNIDVSHFTKQGWNKGMKFPPKRDIEEYLTNKASISSNRLKKRLLIEGIFSYECSGCELTTWRDRLIPLELDHIDGNSSDNQLSNLRLLCPNCHALTDTYRGKNIGKPR